MVQLKYFGDSRDYFKYDLITAIFKRSLLRHYVFVPMLTKHRPDNEGKKTPRSRDDKSDDLLEFIKRCSGKSLRHWERWLSRYVDSYKTIEPVDETFFSDDTRDTYWKAFELIIKQKNALIFVDPDTGLETGKPLYLRKMGREKYLLNDELKFLINGIAPSSVLMLYQHLPKNKHMHIRSVGEKLEQVHSVNHTAYTCAYREDDLAFLFISKKKEFHEKIQDLLKKYHANSNSNCKYKSLHCHDAPEPIEGKLSLREFKMADPIADKMQQGVDEGVFPGAVLLVEYKGKRVHHAAYGCACLLPEREPVNVDTIYDLASLTKPIATATAAAFLVADGQLRLDDPLGRFVPELAQDALRRATIRHLLNHSSGLPAWRPFYERIVPDGRTLHDRPLSDRRAAIYDAIHREPLAEPVGGRCVYSDLGFILLGEILERVTKQEWSAFCHGALFPRLGASDLFYMSESGPPTEISLTGRQFAATEQDDWRGRIIRGEVHDENAAVMGGVSSHAGLFGMASAVARAVSPWLAAVRGESSPIPASWAKEFVRKQGIDPQGSWALGWDTPSTGPAGTPSSSGAHFSPGSFGHLGYAGTSVWIDPERDLIVVLLTNRVHPTRKNDKIRAFRPAIHDVIFKTVVGA